jgi:hypothetical protein
MDTATPGTALAPRGARTLGYATLALTIFLSAFLLFQVQPMMTKVILPWFGGSPAVWTTAVLFFQCVLFLGYCYAHAMQKWLGSRHAAYLHIALLVVAALSLPILPSADLRPRSVFTPVRDLLALLFVTVGAPYFLLSSTGPLVQAWFGRLSPGASPYRLYALSNVGSLLALLTYPTLIEPHFSVRVQARFWTAGFLAFAALCALAAWWTREIKAPSAAATAAASSSSPRWRERALWVALPALASLMLLATTNHVCQNVAPVPLLWVVPLALYLLSFILCFDHPRWYRRGWSAVIAAALLAFTSRIGALDAGPALEIGLYVATLFAVCMVCHGEVYRLRPQSTHLTEFYLCLSGGGALGGIFASVAAPLVFRTFLEFRLGVVISTALCILVLYDALRHSDGARGRVRRLPRVARAALAAVVLVPLAWAVSGRLFDADEALFRARNFYGTVAVFDEELPSRGDISPQRYRAFLSGHIWHGRQYLAPELRREPLSYFGRGTGVATALSHRQGSGPVRVGVLGLGVGTLAAYARPGDVFRFYEINPQVEEVARRHFSYLADCLGRCEVALGDGRLVMDREPPQRYDVLVLDAFTSDAPPAHLLTVEAFATYLRHLEPDGILVVNATNTYLDLAPLVLAVGRAVGLHGTRRATADEPEKLLYGTDFVLLSRNEAFIRAQTTVLPSDRTSHESVRLWTDDFTNLFDVLLL